MTYLNKKGALQKDTLLKNALVHVEQRAGIGRLRRLVLAGDLRRLLDGSRAVVHARLGGRPDARLGRFERRRLGEVDRDRIARLVVDLPEVERDQRERTDQQQRVDRRRNRRPPAGIPVIWIVIIHKT